MAGGQAGAGQQGRDRANPADDAKGALGGASSFESSLTLEGMNRGAPSIDVVAQDHAGREGTPSQGPAQHPAPQAGPATGESGSSGGAQPGGVGPSDGQGLPQAKAEGIKKVPSAAVMSGGKLEQIEEHNSQDEQSNRASRRGSVNRSQGGADDFELPMRKRRRRSSSCGTSRGAQSQRSAQSGPAEPRGSHDKNVTASHATFGLGKPGDLDFGSQQRAAQH